MSGITHDFARRATDLSPAVRRALRIRRLLELLAFGVALWGFINLWIAAGGQ
jgi:hypothetical protein